MFLNVKGIISLLPKLKLGTKLLRSSNLLQKRLQSAFPLFFTNSLLLMLRTILTSLILIFFNTPYISDSDFKRAISCLRSTKCVGPDEIPNFIIKDCSNIFIPLLRHIFSLSLLTGKFPSLSKQWLLCLFLRKAAEFLLVIIDLSRF
jgi:hypothetical protein